MVQGQPEPENRREELHYLLVGITPNCYFQPPPNHMMQYPCIRYEQDDAHTLHADNAPYRYTKRYEIMVIDDDPDSLIQDAVAMLPSAKFVRKYVAEDLHHFVFTLFF